MFIVKGLVNMIEVTYLIRRERESEAIEAKEAPVGMTVKVARKRS